MGLFFIKIMLLAFPERYIGSIITTTITVEKGMDRLLSQHFCADKLKGQEFSNMILFHERITFDFKKEILTAIIKKHHNWLYDKFPLFNKYLSEIPEHRNRFAHLELVGYRNSKEIDLLRENNIPVLNGMDQQKKLNISDEIQVIFKKYKNGNERYIGYDEIGLLQMMSNLDTVATVFAELYLNIKRTTDPPPEKDNI